MVIKRDFRTLAPAMQAELRRVAVAMVRAGKTRVEAAETVGVNRRFVGQWVKVAAQRGEAVLVGRRRGRRPGEQKALSAVQEDRLRGLVLQPGFIAGSSFPVTSPGSLLVATAPVRPSACGLGIRRLSPDHMPQQA